MKLWKTLGTAGAADCGLGCGRPPPPTAAGAVCARLGVGVPGLGVGAPEPYLRGRGERGCGALGRPGCTPGESAGSEPRPRPAGATTQPKSAERDEGGAVVGRRVGTPWLAPGR